MAEAAVCRFPGFVAPRYTPIPDEILDELLPVLSHAELRVLLYICRRTFGFGKPADAISFNQFRKGIVTGDGRRLDHGCGVTNPTRLSEALKKLEAAGYIVASRACDPRGEHSTTVYALRVQAAGPAVGVLPDRQHPTTGTPTEVLPDRQYGSTGNSRGVLPDRQSQETVQDTEQQDTGQQAAPAAPEDAEAQRIWCEALAELRLQMNAMNFETWFASTRLASLDLERRAAVIVAPNAYSADWLRARCAPLVERTLYHLLGRKVTCAFTVEPPAVQPQVQGALL